MGLSLGGIGDALSDLTDTAKSLAPTIGTALGFYFGGPAGAALGGGIGGLVSGGDLQGAATGAAMGYGIGSLAGMAGAPRYMPQAPSTTMTPVVSQVADPRSWGYGPPRGMTAPGDTGVSNIGLYSTPDILNYDIGNTTSIPAAQAQEAIQAAAEKPFWESDWMKYGTGIALLAGMFEDPNYETIDAPDREWSEVDKLYGGPLAPAPADRRFTFGSKRSSLGRR